MPLGEPNAEGVVTMVPGTTTRALRYSSHDAVPLFDRWHAKQIGAAGWWYTPTADTLATTWDKITGNAAVLVEKLSDDVKQGTGADHGVLGVFSKLLGIPYPLSVALVLFLAYALLRGAGLVPPVGSVIK